MATILIDLTLKLFDRSKNHRGSKVCWITMIFSNSQVIWPFEKSSWSNKLCYLICTLENCSRTDFGFPHMIRTDMSVLFGHVRSQSLPRYVYTTPKVNFKTSGNISEQKLSQSTNEAGSTHEDGNRWKIKVINECLKNYVESNLSLNQYINRSSDKASNFNCIQLLQKK